MSIQTPKGTRDILPSEIHLWHFVESKVQEIFEVFGYHEIRTPIFEHTELFVRGVGDTTDIVEKEMYTFADKGGRSLSLRPEGTASIVRACIQNRLLDTLPVLKLYYTGQMFRYERPQAGRYREFWQAGVEAFGSANPLLDAEVIDLAYELLADLGLKQLSVQINSLGDDACRPAYTRKLLEYIERHLDDLCGKCVGRYERNPLRVLDCKEAECRTIMVDAPKSLDHLCEDCQQHFEQVQHFLNDLEVDYAVNPYVVRGLDYYTRTAFAVVASGLGAQDEVLGGGRYDKLVESLGGKPTPGVGFAFGLDRLILALEAQGVDLLEPHPCDVYIAAIGTEAEKVALKLSHTLRQQRIKTDMEFAGRSLRAQMKTANKIHARYTILLGDNELARNTVVLRNMQSGDQSEISQMELMETLLEKLNCCSSP